MFFLASLLSYSVIQKIIAQQKRSSSEQAYHRHHREERHGSGHDEDRRDEDVSQTFPITCFGTLKNLKESGFVPPNTGCTKSKITLLHNEELYEFTIKITQ